MALVEMVMPKMGESIMEGTVLTWLKQEGDTIEADESVLEVATDKVDTEVPAIHAGVLKEILVKEGDVVAVGAPIARIETEASAGGDTTPAVEATKATTASEKPAEATSNNQAVVLEKPSGDRFYSPLVMNIAREEGISMSELERVPGTGREDRVTKKDILAYVKNRPQGGVAAAPTQTQTAPSAPAQSAPKQMPVSISGEDEIIEMDRMRKMIAERMVDSKRISPHVTSFVEADVSNVVAWRNKVKNGFMEREGEPITFTPIFIEAIVKAIKDYPMINIQVDGSRIIKKKDINIGLAVALPSGNLIVPVIHRADQYNLTGLTKKVNALAKKARENKLTPDDLQGGTFTVSNVGSFGNVMGTPIIMQPQVAIMALGAVVKKPAVIETPSGDAIAIRHKMFLSHSYDHRVVDGSLGGMVVRRVADYLEKFDLKQTL
ncbi:2-oxoglutarate dehydrogenase E2 component (dihydrolipoamide succinyltransferase) [Roseivirga ehrenbergii]|uniref:Dihydrolipoamide acetyltransferase component of pyruvate dehydrogenase complex n=1 Tax=Roseivirga ehrenbergii (strain DSM 102268 / JCM 13514 / KCTC 12282 / NCIMB 14502 / KMM 6017) TaxID=279360 RepID=A0A150WXQ3_ROSEK|nr:dihydrolipoamide acetyltransferase family protein [Roseivirga ehrenbergii]KYG71265.1 2-oxoglutarate dehydrogenase [Roseivirga ehrenbergii]TCK99698.1 2-oxoglutarate dehydrogenase E2 component (dihydrolipoamide succinyltransferase) [Roseivirga ehrenbergii]